jgi:hypothetical protein
MQGKWVWAFAFGLAVAPMAGMGADLGETPVEPLPDAFYISPSAGVLIFDFDDIEANAIAVDGNNESIDLKPDFDRVGPVLGGSFGARLGEFSGATVRLRGSGFYSWYDDDDTVALDEFGAIAWKGLFDGSSTVSQAAAAAASLGGPAAAAAPAGNGATQTTFSATQTSGAPPSATAEAGAFNETGGVFAAAGDLDEFGIAIDYDEELAYWGGELAFAFDNGASENGAVFTPFFGVIVRGIDRDLETTLNENVFPVALSLEESLDGRYYGAVIGIDVVVPLENGMVADLSISGAPLYLDADYEGQEVNSIFGSALAGPKLEDSDNRLAGLFRARAGIGFPVFGHSLLRIGGEVEYLTDAPTIDRTLNAAAVAAANSTDAAAAVAAGGGAELAELDFEDMFAFGLNASLIIPFGQ